MSPELNRHLLPSVRLRAITPHNSTEIAFVDNRRMKALYVGGAGNITVIDDDATTVLLTAVPVGKVLNISPNIIKATGTTATNLVALY